MVNPCGVVANKLNCNIIVSEFKLQICYYVHFQTNHLRKDMNSRISLAMVAQSDGAVEYTDCFSAEEQDSSNEGPGYDTK